MNSDCPFCNLDQTTHEIICETGLCVVFYDNFPVSQGHTLIIPKRHVYSFFDLTDQEMKDINNMIKLVKFHLDSTFHPDGYNIGVNINEAAGQSVFHCHIHIIPRYKGDVKNPKGGVRGVIPNKQQY